jgi:lipoprotein-anchoring transpeptidase ErfK/SrfK
MHDHGQSTHRQDPGAGRHEVLKRKRGSAARRPSASLVPVVFMPVSRRLGLALIITVAAYSGFATSAFARETVRFDGYSPGTVVIKTSERRLYYVLSNGTAIRYPVGVGRSGKSWTGSVYINGKYLKPDWSPPAEVKRDNPRLPAVIKGGTAQNPMGAAALTLSGGGEYAIHGTNVPSSVGGFVSYGCFRMYNSDVTDLFGRVSVGTPVVVTQ